ncbi:MAG: hypothetical protein D0528_00515 [Methylococcales bacterium]|nr:MAG: hypothetical protein D0528_00515 [Methylococcales bacterium]
MAQITIGGALIQASLSNYRRLKRAWKYIAKATEPGADFTDSMDAIIGVIAVGLDVPLEGEPVATPGGPAVTPEAIEAFRIDWIAEHLSPTDIKALRPFMTSLMVEAGLTEPEGEDLATGSPSTVISTES